MIKQCEKCALYNSCAVGSADSKECDEYIPNEESKITDPIKKRLFNLLKDSPSLNVLYEEQWTESVDYLVSNGVTLKSEVIKALNEVELLIIITKEMYKQQMVDAPNELSKQSKRTKWVAFEKFYDNFAEIKKNYTEGGGRYD